MKPITGLQKGRMALDYIKMTEQPEDFMLHNRYLDKRPQLVEEYESDDSDII